MCSHNSADVVWGSFLVFKPWSICNSSSNPARDGLSSRALKHSLAFLLEMKGCIPFIYIGYREKLMFLGDMKPAKALHLYCMERGAFGWCHINLLLGILWSINLSNTCACYKKKKKKKLQKQIPVCRWLGRAFDMEDTTDLGLHCSSAKPQSFTLIMSLCKSTGAEELSPADGRMGPRWCRLHFLRRRLPYSD